MSAFGGKADTVRRSEHTFKSLLQICEGSYVRAEHMNFGGRHCLILLSYGPFKLVSDKRRCFLFLYFPFKDLTQNQECYWPNGDPNS